MSSRMAAVAGQFYPQTCSEIVQYLERFNNVLDDNNYNSSSVKVAAKAIIVPHAGYIYSGFTANVVFRTAAEKREITKRVVVIGPSHRVYIAGASIALFSSYDSPCGSLRMDLAGSNVLNERFDFLHFQPDAHHEHSTEVQMPFVQHYFPEAEVVEIVYGDLDYRELSQLIDTLLSEEETLVVISTDLSHFHSQQEAKGLDSLCIEGVAHLDIAELERGCEACGMIGVKAVIASANKAGLRSQVLDYRSSADVTGDKESVVGYLSAVIGYYATN